MTQQRDGPELRCEFCGEGPECVVCGRCPATVAEAKPDRDQVGDIIGMVAATGLRVQGYLLGAGVVTIRVEIPGG